MKWIHFNLNSYVRVRLNDLGYQLLADRHNRYVGSIRGRKSRTAQYYKEQADPDGYTSFQAWDFFETFGDTIGLAKKQYFDINILVEDIEGVTA